MKVAELKGAGRAGGMKVEYAVLLRFELIPEGAQTGPMKNSNSKVLEKGTCGIARAVFGWPTENKHGGQHGP